MKKKEKNGYFYTLAVGVSFDDPLCRLVLADSSLANSDGGFFFCNIDDRIELSRSGNDGISSSTVANTSTSAT